MQRKFAIFSFRSLMTHKLALLFFALCPLISSASTYSYKVSDGVQKVWSNPSNDKKNDDLTVNLSGAGQVSSLFKTTGSAIEWKYDVGFNAPNISFSATSGISITKSLPVDSASTGGKFWGYPYINHGVLDTLTTQNSGSFASLIHVGSGGTPGLAYDARNLDLYRGGNGGKVTAVFNNSSFSMKGATSIGKKSSISSPDSSVLYFNSTGGDGGASKSGYFLDAGSGGAVTAEVYGSKITFDNQSASSIWAGITATSIGGAGGMCCVAPADDNGQANYSATWDHLPTTAMTGSLYSGVDINGGNKGQMVTHYGRNGDAGSVDVLLTSTSIEGQGSKIVGVSAASLGGALAVPNNLVGSGRWDKRDILVKYRMVLGTRIITITLLRCSIQVPAPM